MTQIRDIDQKCSVCGKSSPQPVLISTNTMGYPDLDLRPAEMQRSTMITWIHECPECGYVAGNLEEKLEIPKEMLKSEEYLTCEGRDFKGKLSEMFYKQYLIGKHLENAEMCFYSLRNCAWKCDDHDDENASDIRKLAISYLDTLISKDLKNSDTLKVIKSDFLRRSGEFEKLIEEYENIEFDEKILNDIISFQLERAAEKDTDCYTIEDVAGH